LAVGRKFEIRVASGRFLRALADVPGLDPGGGKFGLDGRYYVGSRSQQSIIAFEIAPDSRPSIFVPGGTVGFPRGLACSPDGNYFLAGGVDPVTGNGRNTIYRFDVSGHLDPSLTVLDTGLSPLDADISPAGNLLVSSEQPFGDPAAFPTVREYDVRSGALLRVFDAGTDHRGGRIVRNPRGIAIGPDSALY
jgi:DNA-binding beta-propeller fold protein YncE